MPGRGSLFLTLEATWTMRRRTGSLSGRMAACLGLRRTPVEATWASSAFSLAPLLALQKCPDVEYPPTRSIGMLFITRKVQQEVCSMAPRHPSRPGRVRDGWKRHVLANTAVSGNTRSPGALDGWER